MPESAFTFAGIRVQHGRNRCSASGGLRVQLRPESPFSMGRSAHLLLLGLKQFRMPPETARVMPTVFSDDELRSLPVPTLLLYGDREVICDPAAAVARARRLMPALEADLIPGCRHDMCASQYRIVDERVLDFLKKPTSVGGVRVLAAEVGGAA